MQISCAAVRCASLTPNRYLPLPYLLGQTRSVRNPRITPLARSGKRHHQSSVVRALKSPVRAPCHRRNENPKTQPSSCVCPLTPRSRKWSNDSVNAVSLKKMTMVNLRSRCTHVTMVLSVGRLSLYISRRSPSASLSTFWMMQNFASEPPSRE